MTTTLYIATPYNDHKLYGADVPHNTFQVYSTEQTPCTAQPRAVMPSHTATTNTPPRAHTHTLIRMAANRPVAAKCQPKKTEKGKDDGKDDGKEDGKRRWKTKRRWKIIWRR